MLFWYCLTCWCRFSVQNLIRICYIFFYVYLKEFNYIVVYCRHFRTHISMGPICCSETSVTNYQHMLCNNPKEQKPQLHCERSLKPCTVNRIFFCNFNFVFKQQWSELQGCMEFYEYVFYRIAQMNPLLNVIELC